LWLPKIADPKLGKNQYLKVKYTENENYFVPVGPTIKRGKMAEK
jgi:hypothetical protein